MSRIAFDKEGRLKEVDGQLLEFASADQDEDVQEKVQLHTSSDMTFLKEDLSQLPINKEKNNYWSLYDGNKSLPPLQFSNGKNQADVVKEVVDLIKSGKKIVLIHGMCGTGKSAIALNIAKLLGKTSIVVPIKNLQRQYEEDYTIKKSVLREDGKKLKIAVISGRENHDSIIKPGVSCADPSLPDTIRLTEKNYEALSSYYLQNPLAKNKEMPPLKDLRRVAIAPANPHWSPILPAEFEFNVLKDAKKILYRGLNGKDFIFYHRKPGCSYYDQYLAYARADVIVFNAAKYKIEVALDRKPDTAVDIIDEADEFLDNFSMQEEINISRLATSLKLINVEKPQALEVLQSLRDLVALEEKNKSALGIDENALFKASETQIEKILKKIMQSSELMTEIMLDESNYANKVLEAAINFKDYLSETYVTFKRYEKDIVANIVSTNLSSRFKEIMDKTNALVLMSGTLHSEPVLRKVFGLKDVALVEAEVQSQGVMEICRTGTEMDCRYSNMKADLSSRAKYLDSLYSAFKKAPRPTLIHVNAFEDLPSEDEIARYQLYGLMSREALRDIQKGDKNSQIVSNFKKKIINALFTTKCSRGVDFPGDMCNSVIFTKFPNPNPNDVFWKVLQKNHPDYFWDFYKDKARREFLQRVYRALRSKDDHVFILSPDSRILSAVRELQMAGSK